jgi:uncharacterized protein (DUF2267 family)
MHYDSFLGQVQHRARVADGGEAMRAVHATLQTLGERLTPNEAHDLAAQLPMEIGDFLIAPSFQEKFGLNEFFRRVAEREEVTPSEAMLHSCAVISVLLEAVSRGEMADVCAQLPHEFDRLFELAQLDVVVNGRA